MTRRCSHCSNNGHNSRTCPNRGVKLFGVRLTDGSIRKSASMGNLTHFSGSGSGSHHSASNNQGSPGGDAPDHAAAAADGYASEDFVPGSSSSNSHERKKGVPWTEEEHRMFLLGLQKLGKGDWRGIARTYVPSRTPTQVASHAQKYFIRQTNVSRQKRRSSLFDIIADGSADTPMAQDLLPANQLQAETEGNNPLPPPPALDEECESMDSTNINDGESASLMPENSQSSSYAVLYPTYYPLFSLPPYGWSGFNPEPAKKETHEVLKPTAVHSKSSINVDELVGMSKLSLGDSIADSAPSSLSLKLLKGPSRQSAFQATPACSSSNMNGSAIHAV